MSTSYELASELPESATSRKRPRTLLACDECRRRRSKCDVVKGPKCYRCDSLGSHCSFLNNRTSGATEVLDSLPRSVPSASSSPLRDGEGGPGAILQRIKQLEEQLRSYRSHIGYPETSCATESRDPPVGRQNLAEINQSTAKRPQMSRDEVWYREADPETFGLINRGMEDTSERGLEDPVEQGIITASQAELAYQVFKQHCVTVLPYPTLLLTRSRLPSHPFLRAACLVYAARCSSNVPIFSPSQVRELENNAIQNLMAFHRGCRPSLESAFGALILSLLPVRQDESGSLVSDFDPARMAGTSYGQIRELGSSVFIERIVDSLEFGSPLHLISEALDRVRLHFCILTRVSWTNISRCPSNDLPTTLLPVHHRLLYLLQERGWATELDRHLVYESQAMGILTDQSNAWRVLERLICPSTEELRDCNDKVANAVGTLEALRIKINTEASTLTSFPWLLCQITYLKWWATIRNIWFFYHLATPLLVDSVRSEWLRSMKLGAQASSDMITRCLAENWNLKVFPRVVATALLLCTHTLAMGSAHLNASGLIDDPAIFGETDDRRQVEELLHDLSPSLRSKLRRAHDGLDEYKRQLENRVASSGSDGHDSEQVFDWSDSTLGYPFDFSLDGGTPQLGHIAQGNGISAPGRSETMGLSAWNPLTDWEYGWSWQDPVTNNNFWER